jgi:hypothetical protein
LIIVVAEKNAFAPVAALRDVMRQSWDDETSNSGHFQNPGVVKCGRAKKKFGK